MSSSSGLKMKNKKVYESLKNNLCTYSRMIIEFVGLLFRRLILERDINGKKNQLGEEHVYKSSERNVVCEKDVLCLLYQGNEPQEDRNFILH